MKSDEYLRVGNNYYKKVQPPSTTDDKTTILKKWSEKFIIADYGRDFLTQIPKYDGFCNIPDHINYKQTLNNFYNQYEKLPNKVEKIIDEDIKSISTQIPYSIKFLKHIFQEQLEIGLDYLKILLEYPAQVLPILCLVSRERATGKSTFIKWVRNIFGRNVTYIKGDTFASQFNADWASKLVVAVDEVFFDKKEITERLKYLSTTNKDKVEAKGQDRYEVDFFAKFILCSNNEDSFIQVDPEEIRFWVLKIPPLEEENVDFLELLTKEIPLFLNYIYTRPFHTHRKTRMWFTYEQTKTKALIKLIASNNQRIDLILAECLFELFEEIDDNEVFLTAKDFYNLRPRAGNKIQNVPANEIRKTLKKWNLSPQSNSLGYSCYSINSMGDYIKIDKKGRFYTIDKVFFLKKYDDLMTE